VLGLILTSSLPANEIAEAMITMAIKKKIMDVRINPAIEASMNFKNCLMFSEIVVDILFKDKGLHLMLNNQLINLII